MKRGIELSSSNKQGYTIFDWWVGTVFLAFFPIAAAIILSLVWHSRIDLVRIVGDGEIILSSFMIAVPSIIRNYHARKTGRKLYFYFLLIITFFQLMTYAGIKVNPEPSLAIVYITSVSYAIIAIIVSFANERFLDGGRKRV